MELLSSRKAMAVIQEFWNSDEKGIEVTEGLKTRKTAMAAVHDCGLVGKIMAVEKTIEGEKKLFLINTEKVEAEQNAGHNTK